jgi:hypothetical protein
MQTVRSRDVVAVDLAAECQNVASDGAKSDVMDIDFTFDWSRLIGPFKISGDPVSVLRDLHVLDDRLAVLDVC